MSNDYYVATSNVPPADTRSNPELYTKAEFALIEDAFDKFPALSSSNAFRLLTVGSGGLSLGLGYQEAPLTQPILLVETAKDLPGMTNLRIDAGGVYRLDGTIIYATVSATPSTEQAHINLEFTETPSYSAGIAISGGDVATEFSLWETEIIFTNDGTLSLGEFHGVIVGGAQNAILSLTAFAVGTAGSVAIARSSNIKLTRFYGD